MQLQHAQLQQLVLQQQAAAAAAAAAQAQAQAHSQQQARNPRRARVVTIQISLRTLLQALVFGVVLYRTATWRRVLALCVVGAAYWLLTSWPPLRQLVTSLLVPPPAAAPGGAARPAVRHFRARRQAHPPRALARAQPRARAPGPGSGRRPSASGPPAAAWPGGGHIGQGPAAADRPRGSAG
jgi:hypothetical protein